MAKIARKLPSKAKMRLVNVYLGHSFVAPMVKILFFFLSWEKTPFFRSHRETKKVFLTREEEKYLTSFDFFFSKNLSFNDREISISNRINVLHEIKLSFPIWFSVISTLWKAPTKTETRNRRCILKWFLYVMSRHRVLHGWATQIFEIRFF